MPLFRPSRCQICTTPLRRSTYVWKTDGQTVYVCPKCNTRLENMKSRAAFDPTKTFVFPPIIKSSGSLGCGPVGAMIVGFIVIVAVMGSLTRNAPSTPPPDTVLVPASVPSPTNEVPPPSEPEAPAPVASTPTRPPEVGAGVALKDSFHFPLTIVVAKHIDVVTSSGGFGLDPGDELLIVSRQDDGSYVVSRSDQQYTVNAKLLDDEPTK